MNPRAPSSFRPPPDQTGFTLIELVAVMALLAVNPALAVPRYFSTRDKAARMAAASAAVAEGRARVAQFAAVYIADNTIAICALRLTSGAAPGATASGALPRPGSTY